MPFIDDTTVLAKGSTTRRKTEDRFAEAINVKDRGATGNGTTDDTAAIQAAIDWTASNNRNVIFFPEGDYLISAPLTFTITTPCGICFCGTGRGSRIFGNFAGFLIDRPADEVPNANQALFVIEKLYFENYSVDPASGGVRWDVGFMLTVRNCLFYGFTGLFSMNIFGIEVTNCDFLIPGGGVHPASIGLYLYTAGGGAVSGCSFFSIGDGIRIASGCTIQGCRFENCGNAINVGTMHEGSGIAVGAFFIGGCGFEANDCGIYVNNGYNGLVCGCGIHGHSAAFYSGYGAGGTGPLPGADTPPEQCSTYGIFVRYSNNVVWIGNKPFDMFNAAAVRIEDGTQLGNVWIGCEADNGHSSGMPPFTGSTTTWSIGGTSHKGLKFIDCKPAVDPVMIFADLPATAADGRAKGAKYCITNGGSQAIGAAVSAGGGSTFMEVMWNGTAWTRCA